MTSSHARVWGAKRYARRAVRYGRRMTRRGAGCGWYLLREDLGGRGERRRSVPLRSNTRSLRVGSDEVMEGIEANSR